jgi:hypothetical protein
MAFGAFTILSGGLPMGETARLWPERVESGHYDLPIMAAD